MEAPLATFHRALLILCRRPGSRPIRSFFVPQRRMTLISISPIPNLPAFVPPTLQFFDTNSPAPCSPHTDHRPPIAADCLPPPALNPCLSAFRRVEPVETICGNFPSLTENRPPPTDHRPPKWRVIKLTRHNVLNCPRSPAPPFLPCEKGAGWPGDAEQPGIRFISVHPR